MNDDPRDVVRKVCADHPEASPDKRLFEFRKVIFRNLPPATPALSAIVDDYFARATRFAGSPLRLADTRAATTAAAQQKAGRVLGAIDQKARTEADRIWEQWRTLTGETWGSLQWFELERVAQASERQGRIARAIMAFARVHDTSAYVWDILKPSDLEAIMRQVDGRNDSALMTGVTLGLLGAEIARDTARLSARSKAVDDMLHKEASKIA